MSESAAAWTRVIIVNHNAGPLLQYCIDALAGRALASFEAVIVDNVFERRLGRHVAASRRSLPPSPRRCQSRFRRRQQSRGERGPCSLDCHAQSRHRAKQDLARRAEAGHVAPSGRQLFGSTQIDARNPDRVDGFGDVYSIFATAWRGTSGWPIGALPPDDRKIFAPCAAAALYERKAFLEAGGFDESFFCYLEDVDFGFRLALRGERCIQVRRAEVLHFGSVSAGEDSDFFVFHSQRNRLWVLAKNVPSPLIWLVAVLQIAVVPLTVLRRGMGKWRTALKRVAAGLRGLPAAWRQRAQGAGGTGRVEQGHRRHACMGSAQGASARPPLRNAGIGERSSGRQGL